MTYNIFANRTNKEFKNKHGISIPKSATSITTNISNWIQKGITFADTVNWTFEIKLYLNDIRSKG